MRLKLNLRLRRRDQSGFSLIEVMISTAILTVGLVGVLAIFALAIAANQTSQESMIARQLASEAMESVFTARNTSQITFSQIQNVSNGGIFVDGPQNLQCAGPDGIIGTADDAACLTAAGAVCPNGGIECLSEPGFDGIVGTADDAIVSLSNYKRQILITPLTTGTPPTTIPTLVQATVTITYSVPNYPALKTYVLVEYISSYH